MQYPTKEKDDYIEAVISGKAVLLREIRDHVVKNITLFVV